MTPKEIVYSHPEDLLRLCYKAIGRFSPGLKHEEFEDRAMAAVTRVLEKADSYDPARGRLATWIYEEARTANYRCKVYYARRKNGGGYATLRGDSQSRFHARETLFSSLSTDEDLCTATAERTDRERTLQAVHRAAEGLAPRQRTVLYAYYSDDATLEIVGRRLGLTRQRVEQIRNRALCRVRNNREIRKIARWEDGYAKGGV